MFSLFRKKDKPPKSEPEILAEDLIASGGSALYFQDLEKADAYDRLQAASPELQAQVAQVLANWLQTSGYETKNRNTWWTMHAALANLLGKKLPFDEAGLINLLDWSISEKHNFHREIPLMIKLIDRYGKTNPISEQLKTWAEALAAVVEKDARDADDQRHAQRLRAIAGVKVKVLPIEPGEVWADTALAEIQQLGVELQAAWVEFLHHCLMASGSFPSARWLKEAEKYIARIGQADFKSALLRWFLLADRPMPPVLQFGYWTDPDPNFVFKAVNADLLKGLAWASSLASDPDIARALVALAMSAYRNTKGFGPRAPKVGNGCIWALGNMPGLDGLSQLSILKVKLRKAQPQAMITRALQAAAQRNELPEDEIEELSVPTYGLQAVGLRIDDLGEARSKLCVDGSRVEQTWSRADGKRLSSVPKAVQEKYGDELQEIKQAFKNLRTMLPAQRDRIERLYLEKKKWFLPAWQERYLDHPLVGTIARRLIWKFSQGDQAVSGIWWEEQIVGRDGQPVDWLNDGTTVELWHPIHVEPEVVLEWRQWLMAHEIQQPFKQAHREVYLLTDAELETRVYSNRFAGHLLKQHQFHALCEARGWKDSLRLMVDQDVPPPKRMLHQWGLWAEYWVSTSGDTYGADTNDTGTFLYIATDQVRFYSVAAGEIAAPAMGHARPTPRMVANLPTYPMPLEQIAPLVFSEIMRDVDLFVGVTSVGNDPGWIDGRAHGRNVDYWTAYSFGELGETARTRKAVLEALLPCLKIGARCSLSDKFLVVQGDIRTYKIHLGSGNILMEPNNRYLCIVPSPQNMTSLGRIFLPFEGDVTLAIILSKAFLLAEDTKITDPTIVSQLHR